MRTIIAVVAACVLQLAGQARAWAAADPWVGSVNGPDATVYDAPGGTPIGSIGFGAQVSVTRWMYGPALTSDNNTWAQIATGGFVHSSLLKHSPLPASPPAPPQIISDNHWADANITQQVLTLYDGAIPVRMSLMNSGRPGTATQSHPGIWTVSRRVANETMRGDGYDIGGVLFTQYFTDDAEAIHLNYWLAEDERGIPRSHGCLGLAYDDAAFAWRFLDIGSPVYVHD